MPRWEAASISITSSEVPFVIATQAWQVLSGCAVGPCAQLIPLARMRASDVLPVPRGPGEQIGLADFALLDRVCEGAHDRFLPDDFSERLWAVLPVERGHGSIQADPGAGFRGGSSGCGCVYLAGVHGSPGPPDLPAPWTDDQAAHAGRQCGCGRRRDGGTRPGRSERRAGLTARRSPTAASRSRVTGRCSPRSAPAVRRTASAPPFISRWRGPRTSSCGCSTATRRARRPPATEGSSASTPNDMVSAESKLLPAGQHRLTWQPPHQPPDRHLHAATRHHRARPGSRRCTAPRRRRTRICRGRRSCGSSGSTPPS